MTVYITFAFLGTDTGPFNLYSNVDGYASAFAFGLTQAQLLSGFASASVPNGTTIIRAQSFGVCTTFADLPVTPPTTTTTTTCASYQYQIESYNCGVCTLTGGGSINNSTQLTINKFYYYPAANLIIKILAFEGCNILPETNILDSTKQDTCAAIICPTTTTTTTL